MQPVRITIASLYDAEQILSGNSPDKPTHVISIGMPDDPLPSGLEALPHIRLEFADTRDSNHRLPPQRHHVEQAVEFGREAQTANAHLLIHCEMGISRSSGIALAILADQMQEYSPKDVIQHLDGIKENILPNALLVRWAEELTGQELSRWLPYAKDLPLPNPQSEKPIMTTATNQDWQQFMQEITNAYLYAEGVTDEQVFQMRGNDLCWESYTTGAPISMTLGDDRVLQLTIPTGLNESKEDPEVSQTLSNAIMLARDWQQWCQGKGISLPQVVTYPGQVLQEFYNLDTVYEQPSPFRVMVDQQQGAIGIEQAIPIIIACDGACSGNPGPGGWGAIVQYPDGTEFEIGGSNPSTTNNRMELTALIKALGEVYSNSEQALTFSANPVQVIADSQYVINCAQGNWKRKENRDLWAEYEALPTGKALTFEWVRGHEGHPLNERADQLAVQYRDLAKQGVAQEGQRIKTGANAQLEDTGLVFATATNEPQSYPCYVVLSTNQSGQSKLTFYQTWDECKQAVNGVSGVKHKKVKDGFELNYQLEQWGITVAVEQSNRAIDLTPSFSSLLSPSLPSQGELIDALGGGVMRKLFVEDEATRRQEGHVSPHQWWQENMSSSLSDATKGAVSLSDFEDNATLFQHQGSLFKLETNVDGTIVWKIDETELLRSVEHYLNYMKDQQLYQSQSRDGKITILGQKEADFTKQNQLLSVHPDEVRQLVQIRLYGKEVVSNTIDLGDVSGFAEVINQKNGKPDAMIPGDRASVLGNPFDMQNKEALRDKVCDAHALYYERVIAGEEPVAVASEIAQEQGLSVAKAWKTPTREAYVAEWQRIDDLVAQGKQVQVGCWCAGQGRCHLDALAKDWNRDRSREPNPFEQTQNEGNIKEAIAISEAIAPGINIYSRSTEMGGLAMSLTNPSSWAKGRGLLTHSYPVTYNGNWYVDAEAAYQRNKVGDRGEVDRELMVDIIAHKLIQHPELISAINQCGGTQWLEQCRHQTGAKSSSLQWWEGKGRESPFIQRLIDGYERALVMAQEQSIELPETTPFAIPTQGQVMKAIPAGHRDDIVIYSGGQTGADYGGLLGAEALRIPTGGVAPHGWLVEKCDRYPDGRNPELGTRFGLIEGPKGATIAETYRLRTKMNIERTEGTAIFGSAEAGKDPGTYLTLNLCNQLKKPCIHFELAELDNPTQAGAELREWLIEEGIRTLNVAGNRESRYPGLEDKVAAIIQEAVRERLPEKGLEAQGKVASPQVTPTPVPAVISMQCYCHLGMIEPASKQEAIQATIESVKAVVQKATSNGHQDVMFIGNADAIPVLKSAVNKLEATIIVSINPAPLANMKHLNEGDVLLLVTQTQAKEQALMTHATQKGVHVLGYDCTQKGYFNNKQPQQVTTAQLNGKGGDGR